MHEVDALSWDDLRVFLAVIREGSFTRAAARLGVEQSTVSRRIVALEGRLGRALFSRDRRGPQPTHLGERLRSHAERVEGEVHELLDVAGTHERAVEGRVRLALTEALAVQVVIPRVLPALRAAHPALRVDLLTSDDAADLSAREADLALRFFRPTRGALTAQRIATLPIAPLASRAYRPRKRPAAELDWIVYDLPGRSSPELELYERAVGAAPALRCNGYLACVEAVRSGLGVSLLVETLCRWDRSLRVLPLDLGPLPSIDLWLVAPATLRGVPRVDAVWDALVTMGKTFGAPRRRASR
jgi:DNA-binding transcriptional LysR family regulator